MSIRAVMLVAAVLALGGSPTGASPPPHAAKGGPAAGSDAGGHLLTDAEAAIAEAIIEAVSGQPVDLTGNTKPGSGKGLPPGLAKRRDLPPGLARHVARTGQLPPGLQQRITGGVASRMPGHRAELRGTDLLLTDSATGEVVKIIRDVLRLAR